LKKVIAEWLYKTSIMAASSIIEHMFFNNNEKQLVKKTAS